MDENFEMCPCCIMRQRVIDKLETALAERDKEIAAATKIVENQETQIMRLAGEKEQAEARVKVAREGLEEIQKEYAKDIRKRICDTDIAYYTKQTLERMK